MSGLLVITQEGRSTGFELAGCETMELKANDDPSRLLEELEGYSLLCVETSILDSIDPVVLKRTRKKGLPVIISLDMPSKWQGEKEAESPIVRMLRRAIGYQIKIKK